MGSAQPERPIELLDLNPHRRIKRLAVIDANQAWDYSHRVCQHKRGKKPSGERVDSATS
jgi:hypothetical protein